MAPRTLRTMLLSRRVLSLGLLVLLLVGAGPVTRADAAPYDYQDPVQTGCATAAFTVASSYIIANNGIVVGLVELRKGPNCSAYWTRTTSYYGTTYLRADVRRFDSKGNGNFAPFGMSATQIYGNMLSPVFGSCLRGDGYAFGYWAVTRPICWA